MKKLVVTSCFLAFTSFASASDLLNVGFGYSSSSSDQPSSESVSALAMHGKMNVLEFFNVDDILLDTRVSLNLPFDENDFTQMNYGVGLGYKVEDFTVELFGETSSLVNQTHSTDGTSFGAEVEYDFYSKNKSKTYSLIHGKSYQDYFKVGIGAQYRQSSFDAFSPLSDGFTYSTMTAYLTIKTGFLH